MGEGESNFYWVSQGHLPTIQSAIKSIRAYREQCEEASKEVAKSRSKHTPCDNVTRMRVHLSSSFDER